jgi:hypothetical protein
MPRHEHAAHGMQPAGAVDPDSLHPEGPHTHRHGDHVHTHDARADGLVFQVILFALIVLQVVLAWWKRTHPRAFQQASTLGLWLMPAGTAVFARSVRFMVPWVVWSAATAVYVRLARQKPLQRYTPQAVYRFFDLVYRAASACATGGYAVIMLMIMLPPLQAAVPPAVLDHLVAGMLYGLYYAVLTRDVTELAAESIASSLGCSKNKKDDDDSQQRPVPRGMCALCGDDLRAAGEGSAEEEGVVDELADRPGALGGGRGPAPGPKPASWRPAGRPAPPGAPSAAAALPRTVRITGANGVTLYRLECGHTYHEVRGARVGKGEGLEGIGRARSGHRVPALLNGTELLKARQHRPLHPQ